MSDWKTMKKQYEDVLEAKIGPVKEVDHIIKKIVMRRIDLGITQQELALRVGLKQSAIARLESFSIIPRLDTLIKVMQALGLELQVRSLGQGSDLSQRQRGTLVYKKPVLPGLLAKENDAEG